MLNALCRIFLVVVVLCLSNAAWAASYEPGPFGTQFGDSVQRYHNYNPLLKYRKPMVGGHMLEVYTVTTLPQSNPNVKEYGLLFRDGRLVGVMANTGTTLGAGKYADLERGCTQGTGHFSNSKEFMVDGGKVFCVKRELD